MIIGGRLISESFQIAVSFFFIKEIKKILVRFQQIYPYGYKGDFMETKQAFPKSFEDLIVSHDKAILVDFWAEWCPPCKMMNPLLTQLSGEWKEKLTIVKINIDEQPFLASRYGISSIPTMILFKNGKEVRRVVGAMSLSNLKKSLETEL